MPAKNSQPVTKPKFNAIIEALKQTPRDLEGIASTHGVKESTVKNIRRAKTWAEYERRKAAYAAYAAQAKSARRAMNPVPRPVAKKAVAPSPAKRAIVVKEEPAPEFVTREELRKEVMSTAKVLNHSFSERAKLINKRIDALVPEPAEVVAKAREARKPFWMRIFGKAGR